MAKKEKRDSHFHFPCIPFPYTSRLFHLSNLDVLILSNSEKSSSVSHHQTNSQAVLPTNQPNQKSTGPTSHQQTPSSRAVETSRAVIERLESRDHCCQPAQPPACCPHGMSP
jgi:hypothetical protein